MSGRPRIAMCSPEFYGIEYEINPWMRRSRPADGPTAAAQWAALVGLLERAGASIERIEPVEGLPDLVFTANAAIVHRGLAIVSRFRHEQRRGETAVDAAWLRGRGFEVEELPEGMFFEGAGDGLFCGETLFAGYRQRSDAAACQWVGERLGCRVIPLELVDPVYYHLDTCFCPISPRRAIWFPAAFDSYGQTAIREAVEELVEVDAEEARRFACNAVVVGDRVITNTGCPSLHESLAARGYEPQATCLDEFTKSGGSAKCLTLRLDGEDAAAWRGP